MNVKKIIGLGVLSFAAIISTVVLSKETNIQCLESANVVETQFITKKYKYLTLDNNKKILAYKTLKTVGDNFCIIKKTDIDLFSFKKTIIDDKTNRLESI